MFIGQHGHFVCRELAALLSTVERQTIVFSIYIEGPAEFEQEDIISTLRFTFEQ